VAVLALVPDSSAAQSRNGRIFIVHGIPGADVGLEAAAAVDVSVNGACLLSNFQFRQVVGPIALSAGTYAVAVHVANAGRPCGSPAVIGPAPVPVNDGETAAIVAHLTAEGAPTASRFVLDLSATQPGKARIAAFHTAAAPVVDVAAGTDVGSPAGRAFFLGGFRNGEAASVPVPGASVQLAVYPTGSTAPAFGPAVVGLEAGKAYFFFVVGSVARGTLGVIAQDVSELGG
jgi:hypothetical protein